MTAPAEGAPAPLAAGVVVVAEQLRRPVPGGIGTYVAGLAGGLARLVAAGRIGFPIRLHASRPGPGADPLRAFGLPVQAAALPGPLLVRAWSAGASLRGPAGLVQATSLAAPAVRGAPLVVTVHDLCWRRFPDAYPRRGRAWHEAALRRAAHQASLVVVPSAAVADELVAAGVGIGGARVRVVEEGADHLPPADDEGAGRLLGRLGIDGPFVLAVGTLEPRKNLGRLVAAYARVRDALPERWPLVVAGPAGWGDTLEAGPGLHLAGRVPDAVLAGLYGRARLCAYVPLAEGYGLPVVEAMRAGTPVVSSDVPSAGGASLLVDPLDVASIGEALLAAATDEALRSRLVAAGTDRVEGLTWDRCAEAHADIWKEVAGG